MLFGVKIVFAYSGCVDNALSAIPPLVFDYQDNVMSLAEKLLVDSWALSVTVPKNRNGNLPLL